MGRQHRWLIADSEHRVRLLIDAGRDRHLHHLVIVQEPHGDRAIGPWVIELIAPICRQQELGPDGVRGLTE
jgi:hypothetical protein